MPPTPSSIISDALNSLSKAANLALATVEEQARSDVTRANADASEARRERDDALKLLRDLKLEEKNWERREEAWRAAIKHQAETISHLRAESAQWKAQLTRLEETSRQEIDDWRERCLRAEQERCQLSSRIDELVAEQLAYNTQANAALGALASRSPYPDIFEPSSSSTKRASTSSVAPPLAKRQTSLAHAPDDNAPPSPRKSKAAQTPSKHISQIDRPVDPPPTRTPKNKPQPAPATKAPRTPNTPRATSSAHPPLKMKPHAMPPPPEEFVPQQRVIRRVQAVISVPVKEEEDSDAGPFESDASGSAYEPEQPKRKRTNARASNGRRQSQARRVVEDEDEDEEPQAYRQSRRPRYIPDDDDDDDTDELAMAPDDDFDARPQKTPRTNNSRPSTNTSAKKRKLDADQANGSAGRATNAKVPRKK
ncbi:hypothetical protein EVJ58_g124 [Rhodofomes roseus]|uniref:Uncharacterized protein n=1 Tax=Rhodofomes roseus TaxID=34475 RepID=A0A4Y9Z5X2_9APHY|nr:hypothetical protein EVJ58_g124 [Rhodofomes roseus]